MTLIKSISGIRGTIGGNPGEGLTPLDIVKFSGAYGKWVLENNTNTNAKIVVGRDARVSGEMVKHLINGTLSAMGIDVINLGLASTPTTEIAVTEENAHGGIIITASHNPPQWNALKLLNENGEFLSDKEGKNVIQKAENDKFNFAGYNEIGIIRDNFTYDEKHIGLIKALELVDPKSIKYAGFKIVFDGINSVGGRIGPKLLKSLGAEVKEINCQPTGRFAHEAEPLPENLQDISKIIREGNYDLGFVVDPDVDRLAIINEDGTMFGEEYTLVAVADYILQHKAGNTVSNLSSTKALKDITEKRNGKYTASAVGEVNVVEKMKETNAVIGGEGNGGVIYPQLHYGRDALAGMALFLTYLAKYNIRASELRSSYPDYKMTKNKIQIPQDFSPDNILDTLNAQYQNTDAEINTIDGLKLNFTEGWVHLRKSNTEPILRVIAEGKTQDKAEELAYGIMEEINKMIP